MRTLRFAALALALAVPSLATMTAGAQSTTGQWQNGPNLPYFPVHMSLMPNGKVIMWPGDGGVSGNDPRQLDPATGVVTSLAAPGYDIFCAGQSWLPDGRLFVAGGHISNNVGLPAAVIYDPALNTWTKQPSMNAGRWYPSEQVMPNGDVLVVSGDTDLTVGEDTTPQVWQAATGSWRTLTNAPLNLGLYPTLSLAPNGKVFNSGPNVTTRSLDTTGTGAWTTVGDHIFNGIRDYDSMVMYQPGKILVAGGSDPATNTAEVIDLNQPSPAWRSTTSMTYTRRQLNALMLPDGKVLVTGGTDGPGFSNPDPALAIYAAEEWDPATEKWTTLASATVPRLYHSISMLMPDGRVLSTGGNGYTQSEFFSPPYLFAGPRPTITSSPASVINGQALFVATPNAANITQVSWVRVPSTTHTFSMSQAFYSSTAITQAAGGITITAPNEPTMPPGYYMLFILENGVPSVASMVQLGPTQAANPVPIATSLSPASIGNGSSPSVITVNGSGFVTDSAMQINGVTLATTFISSTQISAVVPANYLANVGTVPLTVFSPSPGGGLSAPLVLSVTQASAPNLTQTGSIIARITAPIGGGSKNLEVIRDGDMPPVGNDDARREYDTYSGGAPATDDWIGYQYTTPQTFATVVFQEGMNFADGGWFKNLNVQVLQSGTWVNVSSLVSTPVYPPNDGVSYETYTLSFTPITGTAIRIDGAPGGASYFMSVGELQVFGPSSVSSPASITSVLPNSTYAGGAPFHVTVNGAGFAPSSLVQFNGATLQTTMMSSNQLVASVPVSAIATPGTASLTVINPLPGGGTSTPVPFAIMTPPAPNLTQTGTIIARITAPTGGGNKNLEVIRDGDLPPVGTKDATREYDTYSGGAVAADDWIGYQYAAPQAFSQVVFEEGINFADGGWFNNLNVQVRQSGVWTSVTGLTSTPVYPPNDGVSFETYTLNFNTITGDAIRIEGAPGGSAYFISVGELEVFGPTASTVTLNSIAPAAASAGDPPLKLVLNGAGFDGTSIVEWNGAPRPTTFVSATQLIAAIPASDLLAASTAQVNTYSATTGTSVPLNFTINPVAVPNLTQAGTIIARINAPTGGGNHNLEVIRDGDMPPVGTSDSNREYDTYSGGAQAADDWIGYQYPTAQTFARVIFQEGMNFRNGGWFKNLNVQVQQGGVWVNVSGLVITPVYPANDGINYETYSLQFTPISGTAIRIDGAPGGSSAFTSVAELKVIGPLPQGPAPTVASMTPTTANSGDSPFQLTVTGSGFVDGSQVQWNGVSVPTTYLSPTQLVARVPAANVATAGADQVSVLNATPTPGISSVLNFTVKQAPVANLTQTGSIIARVTAPTGGGNYNLEVIRDGDLPPVGSRDSTREYDTYSGGAPSSVDWIGYQYQTAQTFTKVVFQEGMNFSNGGWLTAGTIQVLQAGVWVNVTNLGSTPIYPGNDGKGFVTYTFTFSPISGTAIRIGGAPGGGAAFFSIGELQVFGQ